MAIKTPAQMRARYPKLANVADAQISAALAEAATLVDRDLFLVRADYATEVKAAAILEAEKYGQTGPDPKKGESIQYGAQWDELCRTLPIRGMVL